MKQVEQWGMFEIECQGKSDGNPFTDYEIQGVFEGASEKKMVIGFYDGNGIYKVRFMPSNAGVYRYQIQGSALGDNEVIGGEFEVIASTNHGPVHVVKEHYLSYMDGTPYHSIGTTCYAWVNQTEELQEQTLKTLEKSSFNKIRFCIFPKHYLYNIKEPKTYPYVRGKSTGQDEELVKNYHPMKPHGVDLPVIRDFNCYEFNVEHFQRFDIRVQQLLELGIEADIILFHPYDRWGFCTMNDECNRLYLNYMVARYGAYRNVWWSMANEFDLFGWSLNQWESYGRLVAKQDVYHHMISIHNCVYFYDYSQDWITHCSMQRTDVYRHVENTDLHIDTYHKPIVWDEISYEGNIDQGWGNISAQELVRRFWEATLRGGYAGHGETYMHPEDILWWSHGGVLHGESEARFQFLKQIWDETPGGDFKYAEGSFDEVIGIPLDQSRTFSWTKQTYAGYEVHYYGLGRPSFRVFEFEEKDSFEIEVIDTWNMTITNVGIHTGYTKIELPGHEYMAIRLRRKYI